MWIIGEQGCWSCVHVAFIASRQSQLPGFSTVTLWNVTAASSFSTTLLSPLIKDDSEHTVHMNTHALWWRIDLSCHLGHMVNLCCFVILNRYINKVTIQDLQTRQVWHFLCDCWLSADRGDGMTKKTFNAAKNNEIASFRSELDRFTVLKRTHSVSHVTTWLVSLRVSVYLCQEYFPEQNVDWL